MLGWARGGRSLPWLAPWLPTPACPTASPSCNLDQSELRERLAWQSNEEMVGWSITVKIRGERESVGLVNKTSLRQDTEIAA